MKWERKMKSILFVINTMGIGGGEKAILELFRQMELQKYEVSLFVLTGQGELINQIPDKINLLNRKCYPISVHDHAGKVRLFKTILRSMFVRDTCFRRIRYIFGHLKNMIKAGNVQKDKLLWKVVSDGAERFDRQYDLAVAYLEGGAAYYVASHVKAKKKVAFIHINYILAGYNRELDENCYLNYDHIFAVSESVKTTFLSVYPECRMRTSVFYNLLDREKIIRTAKDKGGFSDDYKGYRILTVGRLVPQKALDLAIRTMKILKDTKEQFRWYVLGEGELRKKLEEQIESFELENDFILLGTVENPFPYYAQCDLYVHTARFEGKSIAIEEAQTLGCTILVTEYEGIHEQVKNNVDGMICIPEPEIVARKILDLINDSQKKKNLGLAAARRKQEENLTEVNKLTDLLRDSL